jgi:hypothetical protein
MTTNKILTLTVSIIFCIHTVNAWNDSRSHLKNTLGGELGYSRGEQSQDSFRFYIQSVS